jgi:CheY-like chemotaxis protein
MSLRVEISGPVPAIHSDPAQVLSVLTNLATNAREATGGQGTLTIGLDACVIDTPPAERQWLRPGRYVRLTVADTGAGMDAVARALAFHPFFSTKGLGNGRGLGLAMVYGILKQSRGFVWVDSEPGCGATFTVLFPASSAGGSTPDTHETVLLIESDDQLRLMIAEVLRARRYEVLEARSIDEALPVFAGRSSDIQLVVTADNCDGGADRPLLPRLRTINSGIQVLVMGSAEGGSSRVLPTTPFIQKPFTLKGLADRVRGVLDSGEGRS